jgi:uncharacterized protein YjbI with pentapeptide repeats
MSSASRRRPDAARAHGAPTGELPELDLAAHDGSDGAELTGCAIRGELRDFSALRLHLEAVRVDGLHAPEARMPGLRAHRVLWRSCDLNNARIGDAAVVDAVFAGCRLTGIHAGQASFRDTLFEDCRLDLAAFRYARFRNVVFRRCTLRGAELIGSTLRTTSFTECDLEGLQVSMADMESVDLRGSRLRDVGGIAHLRGAIVSSEQLVELSRELAAHVGLVVRS